jgi:hypothetical protein
MRAFGSICFSVHMASADDILRRMADDPLLAQAIEIAPRRVLLALGLSPGDALHVERVVSAVHAELPFNALSKKEQ